MAVSTGIIEIDLHGKNVEEAIAAAKRAVATASGSVYIVRLIHGFHGGTRIKNAIADEFAYGRVPKVKGVRPGSNQGITDLILRDI